MVERVEEAKETKGEAKEAEEAEEEIAYLHVNASQKDWFLSLRRTCHVYEVY